MENTIFKRIDLVCTCEGCEHRVPVKFPNALLEADILLLNRLCEPDFAPTPIQADKIRTMLGGKEFACPNHGQAFLTFNYDMTLVTSSSFKIILGDSSDPGKPDLDLID